MVGRSIALISGQMDELKQKFEQTLFAILSRLREMGVDMPKENLSDPASGDAFGGFRERSHGALALHAQAEVTHHGAEIALLRDLYRLR